MTRGRILGFATLCLASALAAGAYAYRALQRTSSPAQNERAGGAAGNSPGAVVAAALPGPPGALFLFRNTAIDSSYGRLATAPIENVADRRVISMLSCERVDYAAGRGVCLALAGRGVMTTYSAIVFDQDFQPVFTLRLGGIPSRVRVAPDGRLAAVTVFVSGHSYASGNFSTVTSIIDLHKGSYVIPNFEALAVWRGEQRFEAVDRNFWGVTFARDSDTFYATVAGGGLTHLIKGTVSDQRATVLHDDVECPSLSPDNKRVAFKRRVREGSAPVHWALAVLDLSTMDEVLLREAHSVDDQVAWLDNDRIMYALPATEGGSAEMNTWVIDVRGTGSPRLLVPQSYSTVVWLPPPDGRALPR